MPIQWIGIGSVLATRGRRNAATPVIVRKSALAPNVPNRDLRLTKGHALHLDGVLVPVECLVNHRSIVWDDRAQEVSLYHIELPAHDVLLANGAPAESYRDDGNRWLFRNANTGWDLPPQETCAPLLMGGPKVDALWRSLLQRDGARPGLPTTDEPDLHLMVDGSRLDAEYLRPWRVRIPPAAAAADSPACLTRRCTTGARSGTRSARSGRGNTAAPTVAGSVTAGDGGSRHRFGGRLPSL